MPGKVNPVLCESVLQVAAHVIGCDATITFCGQAGKFELNTMMPLLTLRLIEAIQFSANVVNALVEKCITGIVADRARCSPAARLAPPCLAPLLTRTRRARSFRLDMFEVEIEQRVLLFFRLPPIEFE